MQAQRIGQNTSVSTVMKLHLKIGEKKQNQKNFREFLLHQVLEWTRQQRPLHRSSVLAVSIPLFFMVAHPALGGYLEPNNVYRKSAKVNGKKDNPQHGKVEEQINEVYDTYT